MPRYEFSQGTSNKFWEVSREGTSVTVTYGKIGTKGTSKTKEHPDEAAAEKDMGKQAASKVKKGYLLVEPGGAAPSAKQPLVGLEKESVEFYEHVKRFVHRSVVDYKPGKPGLSQAAKGVAYRIHIGYDEGEEGQEIGERLAALAQDKNVAKLKAIVIGAWPECYEGSPANLMEHLTGLSKVCPELEAMFLGDIVQEECEASWIQLGDWAPILNAHPKLEHFRVRGQSAASAFSNPSLRSLVVQSMTSAEDCRSIAAADLPELEHLELWLGDQSYGGSTTVADLVPILSGKQFPKLRYLGLRNAENIDEVAEALASAPILERIKVLDLSLGTLTDRGGNALLASPSVAKLERLDLHHNWLSPALSKKLRALGPQVDTSKGDAEADDEYRYVSVSE